MMNKQEKKYERILRALRIVGDGLFYQKVVPDPEMEGNIVWEAASPGEMIPAYAFLASNYDEITEEDRAWANKVLDKNNE